MLVALALTLLSALPPERIDAEYRRLDAQLTSIDPKSLPKEFAPEVKNVRDLLDRFVKAEGAEYRLYRLRDAFVSVERLRYVANHPVQSEEAFEKLWTKERPRLDKKTPRGSALERALAQSAATRAERYYPASIAYAKATNPQMGLFYLADAISNLEFRDFVDSLDSAPSEKPPTAKQVGASLDALESATIGYFSAHVAAADANPVSARLKEARELLAAGRVEGAMLLAIEADLVLADRGGPQVADGGGMTTPSGSFSSLLTQWVSNEPMPDRKKTREKAMAFYAGFFSTTPQAAFVKPKVTVTLVRWPYT